MREGRAGTGRVLLYAGQGPWETPHLHKLVLSYDEPSRLTNVAQCALPVTLCAFDTSSQGEEAKVRGQRGS